MMKIKSKDWKGNRERNKGKKSKKRDEEKSVNQSLLLQHNLLFGGADAAPPYIFGSEMTCSSLYCAPHFLVLVRLFPEATSEICLLVRRLWFQHVLNSSITPLVCIDLYSFISSRYPNITI